MHTAQGEIKYFFTLWLIEIIVLSINKPKDIKDASCFSFNYTGIMYSSCL